MSYIETHYNIFGIPEDANEQQIREAYKKLSRQWHPDKNPSNRDKANIVFKKINAANEVLSDPTQRAQYDCTLASHFKRFELSKMSSLPEDKKPFVNSYILIDQTIYYINFKEKPEKMIDLTAEQREQILITADKICLSADELELLMGDKNHLAQLQKELETYIENKSNFRHLYISSNPKDISSNPKVLAAQWCLDCLLGKKTPDDTPYLTLLRKKPSLNNLWEQVQAQLKPVIIQPPIRGLTPQDELALLQANSTYLPIHLESMPANNLRSSVKRFLKQSSVELTKKVSELATSSTLKQNLSETTYLRFIAKTDDNLNLEKIVQIFTDQDILSELGHIVNGAIQYIKKNHPTTAVQIPEILTQLIENRNITSLLDAIKELEKYYKALSTHYSSNLHSLKDYITNLNMRSSKDNIETEIVSLINKIKTEEHMYIREKIDKLKDDYEHYLQKELEAPKTLDALEDAITKAQGEIQPHLIKKIMNHPTATLVEKSNIRRLTFEQIKALEIRLDSRQILNEIKSYAINDGDYLTDEFIDQKMNDIKSTDVNTLQKMKIELSNTRDDLAKTIPYLKQVIAEYKNPWNWLWWGMFSKGFKIEFALITMPIAQRGLKAFIASDTEQKKEPNKVKLALAKHRYPLFFNPQQNKINLLALEKMDESILSTLSYHIPTLIKVGSIYRIYGNPSGLEWKLTVIKNADDIEMLKKIKFSKPGEPSITLKAKQDLIDLITNANAHTFQKPTRSLEEFEKHIHKP